jgi:hypothetical protein
MKDGWWFTQRPSVSAREVEQALKDSPEITESVEAAWLVRRLLQPSFGGALHWAFRQRDAYLADTLFQRLADGDSLASDSPIGVLRRQLLENATSRARRRDARATAAWTVKCFNALLENKAPRLYKLTRKGPMQESFPMISSTPGT